MRGDGMKKIALTKAQSQAFAAVLSTAEIHAFVLKNAEAYSAFLRERGHDHEQTAPTIKRRQSRKTTTTNKE